MLQQVNETDDALIDRLQRSAFDYFMLHTNLLTQRAAQPCACLPVQEYRVITPKSTQSRKVFSAQQIVMCGPGLSRQGPDKIADPLAWAWPGPVGPEPGLQGYMGNN